MSDDGGLPEPVEPDFLFQNGEPLTDEEGRAWFQARLTEAKAGGATWSRISIDETVQPHVRLVESWLVRPANEGPIRFQWTIPPDALLKARGVE